jgi:hypothetical protein
MPLGDPPDDEAGGADAAAIEEIERALRVVDDPRLEPVPRRRLGQRRHAADVEPLLDVDGERVDHASQRPAVKRPRHATMSRGCFTTGRSLRMRRWRAAR